MIRVLTSLLLSLVLATTSYSAAMARGSATAVDQMVICTGSLAITVYVDKDGQPTQATHLCPDCALHVFAAAFPPEAAVHAATPVSRLHLCPASVQHTGAAALCPMARAPPRLI